MISWNFEVAPHRIEKKEKHLRKEESLMKKKIIRIGTKRKPKLTKKERSLTGDIQTKVELIQALIPQGLMAVSEQLEEEVEELAGSTYKERNTINRFSYHRQTSLIYIWRLNRAHRICLINFSPQSDLFRIFESKQREQDSKRAACYHSPWLEWFRQNYDPPREHYKLHPARDSN